MFLLFRIFKTLSVLSCKSWGHMSNVTSNILNVRCSVSLFNFNFFLLSDGCSRWRFFYPCLVFTVTCKHPNQSLHLLRKLGSSQLKPLPNKADNPELPTFSTVTLDCTLHYTIFFILHCICTLYTTVYTIIYTTVYTTLNRFHCLLYTPQ